MLFLIRHAETEEGNDPGLSVEGHNQAKALAHWFATTPLDKVYVSTAKRALLTLEPARPSLHIPIVETDDLKEIYRVLVGGPIAQNAPENRETHDKERIEAVFDRLFDEAKEKSIAVVAHGNIVRYVVARVTNTDPMNLWNSLTVFHTGITVISCASSLSIVDLNLISHLSDEQKKRVLISPDVRNG